MTCSTTATAVTAATATTTSSVGRTAHSEFNKLPTIGVAWDSINNNEQDFNELLNDTIGMVLVKHNVEDKYCAVLNHMHYALKAGENQVTVSRTLVDQDEDTVVSQYLAVPTATAAPPKTTATNNASNQETETETESESVPVCDDLIPIKWRLNLETNAFESYEYLNLAAAVTNLDLKATKKQDKKKKKSETEKQKQLDLRKMVQEFEQNIELQADLKEAIVRTGKLADCFGILLRYVPDNTATVELNDEHGRESKTTSFFSGFNKDEKYKLHPLYTELFDGSKHKLIETSWIFTKLETDVENVYTWCGSCCNCCSHCSSHCMSHK